MALESLPWVLFALGDSFARLGPYWSGQHPAVDPEDIVQEDDGTPPYPFPFQPLELGEAALREFFGYQLEGYNDSSLLDPQSVPLARFKRQASKFKLW
jgi:hypothetical protein